MASRLSLSFYRNNNSLLTITIQFKLKISSLKIIDHNNWPCKISFCHARRDFYSHVKAQNLVNLTILYENNGVDNLWNHTKLNPADKTLDRINRISCMD